jgi:hypothetical protein
MAADIKKKADAIAKQAQKLRDLLCADDPASQYAADAAGGWTVKLEIHRLGERASAFSKRIEHEIKQHSGPANTLRTQSRKTLVAVICRVWLWGGGSPEAAKINTWWKASVPDNYEAPDPLITHAPLVYFIKAIMGKYCIKISDQQIYDDARRAIQEVQRDFP